MEAALESATEADGPAGPQVQLMFHEGSEGIDRLNGLMAECFATTELCPTGRVAFVHGHTVLSAPQIQAPEFERDQIVVSSGGGAVGDLSGRRFQSLVSGSLLHPVLATLPIDP